MKRKNAIIVFVTIILLIFSFYCNAYEVSAYNKTANKEENSSFFGSIAGFIRNLFGESSSETNENDNLKYNIGNINGDEEINLKDLLKLRRYIAVSINSTLLQSHQGWELNDTEKTMADINGDEKIDLMDILTLRRYLAASKNSSIAQNHPEWMRMLSIQEYKVQPYDEYRLAALMHHEFCEVSKFVTNAKVRDESGNWVLASERDKAGQHGGLTDISRTVGYVALNKVLLDDSSKTLEEYINNHPEAYGKLSDSYNSATEDTPDRYCETCLANARHCLKYDCGSVVSSEGVQMSRNCITQSSYDVGCTGDREGEVPWPQPNSLIRWWLVDADGDGKVRDDCWYIGGPMDSFFLRDKSLEFYEKRAMPIVKYDEKDLESHPLPEGNEK